MLVAMVVLKLWMGAYLAARLARVVNVILRVVP